MPTAVRGSLQKLYEAGHTAYVVGGCVRDFLLGRESKDYDIATSALPDELCKIFPKAITVGKGFGVIKVPTGGTPSVIEIATFRKDLEYQDHRHPKGVVFAGPYQDACRRDFTINALFYDPKTSRILDFTNGIEDLHQGVIRAIGNPNERFREDALRLLRAVRFKTRLGFKLDPTTSDAIKARARLIGKISAERVRDELTLMWTGPDPREALTLLSELGLLAVVLPEVEALKGMSEVWKHLLKMLKFLSEQNPHRSAALSWSALLHEVGKPVSSKPINTKNPNQFELDSSFVADKIVRRLKMSREEGQRILSMVEQHLKFKDVYQMRESTLQRFVRQENFEELLAFHKADAMALDGNLAYYELCASRLEVLRKAPPLETYRLVDGKDLIQLGFFPGPEFSAILRVVEDLALEKKIKTKEEALEYVVKHFVS